MAVDNLTTSVNVDDNALVELTCGYIKSYHDCNVIIGDKVNNEKQCIL